jgi:hypothetical protein
MASPGYLTIGAFSGAASGTSVAPALPGRVGLNGALIAVVCSKNNATHSTATSGWTKLNQTNSGANFTASVWVAASNAGAPTFTWTGSVANSAQIALYYDIDGVIDVAGIALLGAVGTGTTSPHGSAGGNTTADDVLAVSIDVCATNTAVGAAAGWTENNDQGSGTTGTRHVFGSKVIATSGTASGALSVTGGAAAYAQFQIQVAQVAPTAGLQISKVEAGAWVDPNDGLSVSRVEAGAWVEADSTEIIKFIG